jgi:hypothetical protein
MTLNPIRNRNLSPLAGGIEKQVRKQVETPDELRRSLRDCDCGEVQQAARIGAVDGRARA